MATAGTTTSEHDEMTASFVHHMNGMREHYTSGATHAYALPIELLYSDPEDDTNLLVASAVADADTDGKAAVDRDIQAFKTSMTDTVKESSAGATKAVNTLKASSGESAATLAFVAAMKGMEVTQQKKTHAQIHKNFQALINTGVQHPKQQRHIMTVSQLLGMFWTALLVKVGKFFTNLGHSIENFLKGPGEWLENAGNSITNWSGGANRSVDHFFSSL